MQVNRVRPLLVPLALAAMVLTFRLGISERVYDATVPVDDLQTLLVRKLASVAAFGFATFLSLLAFPLYEVARRKRWTVAAIGLGAALSLVIEILQAPEPHADQLVDIACGALGGFAAAAAMRVLARLGFLH